MEFREGTEVRSGDGEKLGDIERLVIDPSTESVSHLVVSKGFFFPEERVVPVDIVASADADAVVLDRAVRVDELPVYVQTYYVELDEDSATRSYPAATRAPLVWGYPLYGTPAMYPTYPAGTVTETVRNVPEGATVLPAGGATVITSDGEDIGKVKAIETNDDGELLALDVDPGWFRDEQKIPAHFVREIERDRVLLAVGSGTVRQFQDR